MEHLSLFELNNLVRTTLDKNLSPSYWVVAEIGEMRTNQTGHCYLELVEKEDDKVIAKMRATIWAYTYRNLITWFEGITGQSLHPGIKILCNVVVQFHELYGLSVNIRDIDANFTLGEKAQRRQQVLQQLVADGIFDMNRDHPLPYVPQRIAVISSPTAAGFGDFMDQLTKNSYGYHFHVKLFKAVMQGEKACESMINAMLQVHHSRDHFDALVIIRGGGSQIDLDCFDDYDLACHIAQFSLPVITGIGHERDETIADLVAHTKMKTPTAVAEFIINGTRVFEEKMENYLARLYHYTHQRVNLESRNLDLLAHRLHSLAREKITSETNLLDRLGHMLKTASNSHISFQQRRLEMAGKSIQLLDPQTILKRGYSITTINGKAISQTNVEIGDKIVTETTDRIITSTVNTQKNKDE